MRYLGRGQPPDQGTELILPALSYGILYHRSMVTEVVGDLDSTGKLDLLVSTVGREGHAAQLVANEGNTAILQGIWGYLTLALMKETIYLLSKLMVTLP